MYPDQISRYSPYPAVLLVPRQQSESDLGHIPVFDLEQAQSARDTLLAVHLSPPPDTPIAIFGAGLPRCPANLFKK